MEAQRAASKAASEARAAGARRAELERRLASTRAAYDSLSIDATGEPARTPEP
ncbi:MAG: hypothetical protein AAB011_07075 [Candidatus Eisenbacteria bacterium]